MNLNKALKPIKSQIEESGVIKALDTALTDVAFLEQDEVNVKQLSWDRDIDEEERIVIMTETDYDKYCDIINSAQSLLRQVADLTLRPELSELLEQEIAQRQEEIDLET